MGGGVLNTCLRFTMKIASPASIIVYTPMLTPAKMCLKVYIKSSGDPGCTIYIQDLVIARIITYMQWHTDYREGGIPFSPGYHKVQRKASVRA